MPVIVLQMVCQQENKSCFTFFIKKKKRNHFSKESNALSVQLIRKNFQVFLCVARCLMSMKKLEFLQLEKLIFLSLCAY
jgi:hypothetical protein